MDRFSEELKPDGWMDLARSAKGEGCNWQSSYNVMEGLAQLVNGES